MVGKKKGDWFDRERMMERAWGGHDRATSMAMCFLLVALISSFFSDYVWVLASIAILNPTRVYLDSMMSFV